MTDSQPSDTPKNLEELSQAIDHLEKTRTVLIDLKGPRITVLIGSIASDDDWSLASSSSKH